MSMEAVLSTQIEVRVASVRSRGRFGGVIFLGKTDDDVPYVVVADHKLVPDPTLVECGQTWQVSGDASEHRMTVKGQHLRETQIAAVDLVLQRPSGRSLVSWIANSADCKGIGQVRAQALYDRFGPELINVVELGRTDLLAQVVGSDAASALCEAFEKYRVGPTLLWLDRLGIPRRIASKVVAFWGEDARTKVEANPYVLLSFASRFSEVDRLAQSRFEVALDDPRRLLAAAEEALYRGLDVGHTCMRAPAFREAIRALLDDATLVDGAMAVSATAAAIHRHGDVFQSPGTHLIESYVAQRLLGMALGDEVEGQDELFSSVGPSPARAQASLDRYEHSFGITLTAEQRSAVELSATSRVSLILGGAGTGKTTVLRALYDTLEAAQPGLVIYQLALAGRAAQRMTEATQRPSMTIAAFLQEQAVPGDCLVVVDEMSMVDVILMYRLLLKVPRGARLVLVGDPSQLPPIGPGLVLHALAASPLIPQVELKVVKRQSAASGIPQVAAAIRAHRVPAWARYEGLGSGVSFVECDEGELDETVLRLYADLGGDGSTFDVQILSTTRGGPGGVRGINAAMHDLFHARSKPVRSFSEEFGLVNDRTDEHVPLCMGEPVIYTKNDYRLGLRNGSLGIIVQTLVPEDEESMCCEVNFDGVLYELNSSHLRALRHAYAITVHKSQGSQFSRVIVPVRRSRLLDQTLLYTAVTRGIDQVVFVGNKAAAVRAITSPAAAARRNTMLASLLKSSPNVSSSALCP